MWRWGNLVTPTPPWRETGKRAVISRSLSAEVRPHTDELPEIFPVFLASDEGRAAQLSAFYYERALSFGFDATAVDWKDWEGRILDWTGRGTTRRAGPFRVPVGG
jgi:hypothetical protein